MALPKLEKTWNLGGLPDVPPNFCTVVQKTTMCAHQKIDGVCVVEGETLVLNFNDLEPRRNGVYVVNQKFNNDGWRLRSTIQKDTDSWYDIWESKMEVIPKSAHQQGTSFDFSCTMQLDRKAFDEAKKLVEENFGEPEQLVLSPQDYAALSLGSVYIPTPADQKRLADSIQELARALEAGNYNAAPSELVQGCGLYVEDLAPVMKTVVFSDEHIKLRKARYVFPWDGSTPEEKAACGDPPFGQTIPVTDGWNDMSLPGAKREVASPEEIDRFSEHQKPYNHPIYGGANEVARADHKHDLLDFDVGSLEETPKDYPRIEIAPLVNGRSSNFNCYVCGRPTEHMYARSMNDKFPCHIKCAKDFNKTEE